MHKIDDIFEVHAEAAELLERILCLSIHFMQQGLMDIFCFWDGSIAHLLQLMEASYVTSAVSSTSLRIMQYPLFRSSSWGIYGLLGGPQVPRVTFA